MTEKELRRLKRADLIEIIYKQQKIEQRLTEEVRTLQARLDDRSYRLTRAGTLAEAALSLNGVFDAAQKAADEYLLQIERMRAEQMELLEQARRQAGEP